MRPHRWQPTRLPHPWDSPGSNTGVGCHFLLQCMKVKSESEVAQSCLTLSNPMGCSLSGSSVHGIFQARVLEWGAIAFSGLEACRVLVSRSGIKSMPPSVEAQSLNHWTAREIPQSFILDCNNSNCKLLKSIATRYFSCALFHLITSYFTNEKTEPLIG